MTVLDCKLSFERYVLPRAVALICALLAGCSETRDSEQIAVFPLYIQCLDELEGFRGRLASWAEGTDESVRLVVHRFDAVSEIHSDITGYLEMKTRNVGPEVVDMYASEIELLCFPRSFTRVDRTSLGLRVIDGERRRREAQGERTYPTITDDKFVLYYNDGIPTE